MYRKKLFNKIKREQHKLIHSNKKKIDNPPNIKWWKNYKICVSFGSNEYWHLLTPSTYHHPAKEPLPENYIIIPGVNGVEKGCTRLE